MKPIELQDTVAGNETPASVEKHMEPRAYRTPSLHEIGTLDHVQGTRGVFRDLTWPNGYYPRHD